jgi:hypothetical protein
MLTLRHERGEQIPFDGLSRDYEFGNPVTKTKAHTQGVHHIGVHCGDWLLETYAANSST